MAPPTQALNLDVEAISGICGSVSIACWVVVFSPQIIENFRRGSADGLSIQFIIVWLLGDVFNILGAVRQGVLPTMIILAIYYTIADFVLLGQCFYYRGFTWHDTVPAPAPKPKRAPTAAAIRDRTRRTGGQPDERTSLLRDDGPPSPMDRERRGSDWSHLSPAVPFVSIEDIPLPPPPPPSRLQALAWNFLAVMMVIAAGVVGWWLSRGYGSAPDSDAHAPDNAADYDGPMTLNLWGQVFGWLCAVLYLGSRLPQLLLNWRRKSTDGVSMLFFLFACLGNLTYVMSIMAFEAPECKDGAPRADACAGDGDAARLYWKYILVNLSWLAGSAGTLLLDLGIFVQFFMYNKSTDEDEWESDDDDDASKDEEESVEGDGWDRTPILERNLSGM
ncbi:PQ loop repeat-domain-containing protein [Podospora appendiculata]|uniref:PQ loop repeat-domain-containing protein n=1 Tax=Podospora appendiculata TaxID=314037 RepID=A0AAE0XFV1_9PEZI|nr:PQ loop repeat-domain-containing protein [Podospora appendiculata]